MPSTSLRSDPRLDEPPPPSRLLQLLELRAGAEFGSALALLPLLRRAPRGDGHPVLVLPGFLAGDVATQPLRTFLSDRGYAVHGWGLGRNLGLRSGLEGRLVARLRDLQRETGRRVSLVGWSLGGVFAREVAHVAPRSVRSVVTLGSPLRGSPKSTNAWRLYEWVSGQRVDDPALRRPKETPPPVPITSIYSRSDGVVAWRCSVEPAGPRSESIEVVASHLGLGFNPAVLYAVADRLAQPEGGWRPFDRSGVRGWIYPDPARSSAAPRGTSIAAP